MKKITILTIVNVLVVLLMITLLVSAKLSDETLESVNDLRWKHNPFFVYDDNIEVVWEDYYPWNMYFEDGKLFIETQDGKWFIEMEKING